MSAGHAADTIISRAADLHAARAADKSYAGLLLAVLFRFYRAKNSISGWISDQMVHIIARRSRGVTEGHSDAYT